MSYESTNYGNTAPARPLSAGKDGPFSVSHLALQVVLTCLVFYLWSSPLVQPIKLMVVLFHELSHGMMALFTGGKIISILITADEGGACETEGGSEVLIVTAGYLGSMFVGGMILYLSRAPPSPRLFATPIPGPLPPDSRSPLSSADSWLHRP